MASVSVCIGTHERPDLLLRALQGLAHQERRPDEIIVSDSSGSGQCASVVRSFRRDGLGISHLPSERRALPWHRWFAFTRSSGEIVLFLDDDVLLSPSAVRVLEETYVALSSSRRKPVAGVGFVSAYDDSGLPQRRAYSLRERWLGLASSAPGTMTAGGLTVSFAGLPVGEPLPVDYLWGGAMSFPRNVLVRVGLLNHLVNLYETRLGKGEDAVLSAYAREHGELYVITRPLAWHPATRTHVHRPYAASGWARGMALTWGRGHTLRWMSTDAWAYARSWVRVALLEVGRGLLGIARTPWRLAAWRQVAGSCNGIVRTLLWWHRIPESARSERQISAMTSGRRVHPGYREST